MIKTNLQPGTLLENRCFKTEERYRTISEDGTDITFLDGSGGWPKYKDAPDSLEEYNLLALPGDWHQESKGISYSNTVRRAWAQELEDACETLGITCTIEGGKVVIDKPYVEPPELPKEILPVYDFWTERYTLETENVRNATNFALKNGINFQAKSSEEREAVLNAIVDEKYELVLRLKD